MHRALRWILALVLLTLSVTAFALEAKDGWYHTGDSIRKKSVAFINVKVYAIGHDMRCLPPAKTKQAVIDVDCDKRFTLRMLRDVDQAKIVSAFREAYALNGYTDAAKINAAMAAFTVELKENAYITFTYDSVNKKTTVYEQNGGTVVVPSIEFMKGTWSIWLGKIDPPSIGDELIANL
ncbi:MAG TPA: chalcone isomerase family protein [Polyangiaceae bacterium]